MELMCGLYALFLHIIFFHIWNIYNSFWVHHPSKKKNNNKDHLYPAKIILCTFKKNCLILSQILSNWWIFISNFINTNKKKKKNRSRNKKFLKITEPNYISLKGTRVTSLVSTWQDLDLKIPRKVTPIHCAYLEICPIIVVTFGVRNIYVNIASIIGHKLYYFSRLHRSLLIDFNHRPQI